MSNSLRGNPREEETEVSRRTSTRAITTITGTNSKTKETLKSQPPPSSSEASPTTPQSNPSPSTLARPEMSSELESSPIDKLERYLFFYSAPRFRLRRIPRCSNCQIGLPVPQRGQSRRKADQTGQRQRKRKAPGRSRLPGWPRRRFPGRQQRSKKPR